MSHEIGTKPQRQVESHSAYYVTYNLHVNTTRNLPETGAYTSTRDRRCLLGQPRGPGPRPRPTRSGRSGPSTTTSTARGRAAAREAEPEAELDDVPALLDAIAAQDRTSTSWTCSQLAQFRGAHVLSRLAVEVRVDGEGDLT